MSLAIGQMGMGLETFLQLTPHQFAQSYKKHLEAKREEIEAIELINWQVARWQVWRTLYPPDKKTANQFDILELPGDKELRERLKQNDLEARKKKQPVQRDERRFRALAEKWR